MRLVLGIQGAREAIAAHGTAIRRVLVEQRQEPAPQLEAVARFARERGITVEHAQRGQLDRLAQGERHQGVIVEAPPLKMHALAIGGSLVLSAGIGWLMSRHTQAAFPYLDAFVTVSSVVTTYMVARKLLENWLYWIVVDGLALYLYWQRELYLFVGLFALYLVLVVIGLIRWHRDWRAQSMVPA